MKDIFAKEIMGWEKRRVTRLEPAKRAGYPLGFDTLLGWFDSNKMVMTEDEWNPEESFDQAFGLLKKIENEYEWEIGSPTNNEGYVCVMTPIDTYRYWPIFIDDTVQKAICGCLMDYLKHIGEPQADTNYSQAELDQFDKEKTEK